MSMHDNKSDLNLNLNLSVPEDTWNMQKEKKLQA